MSNLSWLTDGGPKGQEGVPTRFLYGNSLWSFLTFPGKGKDYKGDR